jgi:hypothetical protein
MSRSTTEREICHSLIDDHSGAVGTWAACVLPPPLFKKLEGSMVEEEHTRLEG